MDLQLDFVSSETLESKTKIEKINFIIGKIKENVILILEETLDPMEEAELIETTMREIDTENFHGIEFYRIDHESTLRDKIAGYISGRKTGLTIVGPTRLIEAIKRGPDYISMFAKLDIPKSKKKTKKKK
ncbi:hypothetical protein IPdc08_00713 [archaeon]|nr:hypothetical protein IPdc08_00713 [archaeon]